MTTDEEIVNGDKYLIDGDDHIYNCGDKEWNDNNGWPAGEKRKIVASTEKGLSGVDLIPSSCKSHPHLHGGKEHSYCNDCYRHPKIKTKLDGTVIICEAKKYTQAEVDLMLNEVMNLGMALRQAQLNGGSDKSGVEILREYKESIADR